MGCTHSCGKQTNNILNPIDSRKTSTTQDTTLTRNRTPSFGLRQPSPDHTYDLPREELTGFSCPSGHPLVQATDNLYINNLYTCRLCGLAKNAEQDPSAHCDNCKFDSCPKCLKVQPDIHYACTSGHRLFRVTSLAAFNREQGDGVNRYTCNLCGEDFEAQRDPTYHCSHCDFDICHMCFGQQQIKSHTCPVGHHLFMVNDLQKFHKGMGFYTNNYTCSFCKRELDAKECPVGHCPACLFNICSDCIQKNRVLSEQDNDVYGDRAKLNGVLKEDSSRQNWQ